MAIKENVLTRTDDFIKWFRPKIEKFPRNYKFLFGDRLVEIQLDLLENLVEAYYQKEKLANLRAANIEVERLRHLLKISKEMRFMSFDQLEYTMEISTLANPGPSRIFRPRVPSVFGAGFWKRNTGLPAPRSTCAPEMLTRVTRGPNREEAPRLQGEDAGELPVPRKGLRHCSTPGRSQTYELKAVPAVGGG